MSCTHHRSSSSERERAKQKISIGARRQIPRQSSGRGDLSPSGGVVFLRDPYPQLRCDVTTTVCDNTAGARGKTNVLTRVQPRSPSSSSLSKKRLSRASPTPKYAILSRADMRCSNRYSLLKYDAPPTAPFLETRTFPLILDLRESSHRLAYSKSYFSGGVCGRDSPAAARGIRSSSSSPPRSAPSAASSICPRNPSPRGCRRRPQTRP